MKLILVRHGKTAANEELRYCGVTDLPLSENGKAELAALKENCPDAAGCRVLTSGMLRTDQTLKILYGRKPDAVEPGFAEINFGSFEMHTHEEFQFDPDYRAWRADTTGNLRMPGGESGNEFRARVLRALETVKEDSLIVCHGGVIAVIMQHLFPEENRQRYEWQPAWGHGYVVEDGKWRCF